jgi:hypothetical protein
MVQRVYPVGDLVMPFADHRPAREAVPTPLPAVLATGSARAVKPIDALVPAVDPLRADQLIREITTTVAPRTWSHAVGIGTIEFMPIGLSLVVNQTPAVQEQVARWLDEQRREQYPQVLMDVKVLSVSDALDESGRDWLPADERKPAFLSEAQAARLVEAVQSDRHCSVLYAPRIMTLDQQTASVTIGNDVSLLTGVTLETKDGKVTACPQTTIVPTGFLLAVRPAVSADRKFVLLNVSAELSELDKAATTKTTVTTVVTHSTPDVKPVAESHVIEQPKVQRQAVNADVAMVLGRTVVLQCGRREGSAGTEQIFVLVTPRLVSPEDIKEIAGTPPLPLAAEEQAAPPPLPERGVEEQAEAELAKLLERYHRACAEGRVAAARKLAEQCLNLDPTCFSRK